MTWLLLFFSILGLIWIGIKGLKAKTPEEMIRYQLMPFSLFYGALVFWGLISLLIPGDADGIEAFLELALPLSVLAIALTLLLGIKGILMVREMNDSLLIITSLLSVTVIFADGYVTVVFPIILVCMYLIKKIKRR
jgi:hypothetical protein